MSISKQQWKDIEQELQGLGADVVFSLSDKEVHISRVRLSEDRLGLAVYIGAQICAGWGWPGSEKYDPMVELVWRRRTRLRYSPARKKKMISTFGKRKAKEIFPEIDKVVSWHEPTFATAKTVVRQYKKIPELSIVSIGGKKLESL